MNKTQYTITPVAIDANGMPYLNKEEAALLEQPLLSMRSPLYELTLQRSLLTSPPMLRLLSSAQQ
jgi:hypothetical protein